MLSRLIPKPSHFRQIAFIASNYESYQQFYCTTSTKTPNFPTFSRYFSTNGNNNGRDQSSSSFWKTFEEGEGKFDAFFTEGTGNLEGINSVDEETKEDQWSLSEKGLDNQNEDAIFKETEQKDSGYGNNQWMGVGAEDLKPWSLVEEEKNEMFDFREVVSDMSEPRTESSVVGGEGSEDAKKLAMEEQALTTVLKGKLQASSEHDRISVTLMIHIRNDLSISLVEAVSGWDACNGLPIIGTLGGIVFQEIT